MPCIFNPGYIGPNPPSDDSDSQLPCCCNPARNPEQQKQEEQNQKQKQEQKQQK